jgi:hypothetical protein
MPRQHTTDNKHYAAARRELLRDKPPCHWCGNEATEADHLVPFAEGGSDGIENLVPSCKPCNARRGAIQVNKATARRLDARKHATENQNQNLFLSENTRPRPPRFPLSTGNQPELALTGRDLPRLETIAPEAAGSYGTAVGAWAKQHLDIDLFPWQLRTLEFQLMHDENGDLLHRTSLTSTARQQGKTICISALVGWWLTEMPKIRGQKQSVLSTANRLDLAVGLFDSLVDILEERFGAKATRAYGRNQVVMPDGSKWIIRAAKPNVGHGTSNDLIVADEIWDMTPLAIDGGLLPSMRARRSPLFSAWSTAGTTDSISMLRMREQGLRAIDKGEATTFHMAEWSPSPDMDPLNPASWPWANPSLGRTVSMETIHAESQSPDRGQFLRASCNLWTASDKGWISPGLWPTLLHEGDIPEGGFCAIESSMDEARYYCVRVVPLENRRVLATVEFAVDSFAEVLDEVERLAHNPMTKFLISPSIDIHWPLALEPRRVICGYAEIQKYTGAVRNMIYEKSLFHDGSAQLAEHVSRAVAAKSQGTIALSSQRSSGPIELARCLVWAAAHAARPRDSGRPMVVVPSR